MTRMHVWRIAWKDYRRLRSFWIALVVFYVVGLIYVATFLPGVTFAQIVMGILALAAFYGLGSTGTTFAGEHEEGTYGLLSALPVSATKVFYGKLIFASLSTAALVVVLLIAALARHLWLDYHGTAHWGFLDDFVFSQVVFWVALVPLAVSLGTYWSLMVKRPLGAIGLAGATMVIIAYSGYAVMVMIGSGRLADRQAAAALPLGWSAVVCGVAAALLFVVDRRLAMRWLPSQTPASLTRNRVLQTTSPTSQIAGLARLLWLQMRGSWRLFLLLGIVGAILALTSGYLIAATIAVVAIVGALGILVFRGEQQQQRFRFLGQLGVGRVSYWWSQQLVPGGIALIVVVIAAVASLDHQGYRVGLLVLLGGLATYCIGQLCSIMFSSVLLAIAATLIASVISWAWFETIYRHEVPMLLGIVPVIVLLLLASYLRVPYWLRDTTRRKGWITPAVPLVLLLVGLPLSAAIYRIYEIPAVTGVETAVLLAAPTKEERAAEDAYVRVFPQIPHRGLRSDSESFRELVDWATENPALVRQLVRATEHPDCVFPETAPYYTATDSAVAAASVLIAAAKDAQQQGKLDDAFRYYDASLDLARHRNDGYSGIPGAKIAFDIEAEVHRRLIAWAMHEQNTAQRVVDAAARLEADRRRQPAWSHVLRGEYRTLTASIENPTGAVTSANPLAHNPRHGSWIGKITAQEGRRFPWEKERARRLRDYLFAKAEKALKAQHTPHAGEPLSDRELRLIATTFRHSGNLHDAALGFVSIAIDAEQRRRGVVYQLAAISHYREHGRYPDTFEGVLVDGQPLPNDLFSAGDKLRLWTSFRPDTGRLYVSSEQTQNYGPYYFLLPNFETWNEPQYEYGRSPQNVEFNLTAYELSGAAGFTTVDYEGDFGGYHDYGGYGYGAGHGDVLELMPFLDEEFIRQAIHDAVQKTLEQGDRRQRVGLIQQFDGLPPMEEFVPELLKCVEDSDTQVAMAAVRVLRFNAPGAWARFRKGDDSAAKPRAVAAPVKNPVNGHYYQVYVADNISWKDALAHAETLRFDGVPGHLATITSELENRFLITTFGRIGRCWAGGTDEEEEGTWKWACGPEKGTVFWAAVATADNSLTAFSYWDHLTDEPNDYGSGEDYLVWNWNEEEAYGDWNDLANRPADAQPDHVVHAFLVEYSVAAE